MLAPHASNTTKNPINLCSGYLIPVPESVTNPIDPSDGKARVMRGGGIADTARSCRSGNHHSLRPDIIFDNIGLRVVS